MGTLLPGFVVNYFIPILCKFYIVPAQFWLVKIKFARRIVHAFERWKKGFRRTN